MLGTFTKIQACKSAFLTNSLQSEADIAFFWKHGQIKHLLFQIRMKRPSLVFEVIIHFATIMLIAIRSID